jgi:hypothetical protein
LAAKLKRKRRKIKWQKISFSRGGLPDVGDPCAFGPICGVAVGVPDTVTPYYTVVDTNCIAEIPVLGDNGGGSAVAAGDQLYIGSTGVVSKLVSGGKIFGVAFGEAIGNGSLAPVRTGTTLVASGATTTIQVWVGKSIT